MKRRHWLQPSSPAQPSLCTGPPQTPYPGKKWRMRRAGEGIRLSLPSLMMLNDGLFHQLICEAQLALAGGLCCLLQRVTESVWSSCYDGTKYKNSILQLRIKCAVQFCNILRQGYILKTIPSGNDFERSEVGGT